MAASTLSVIKVLIVPAIISLIIFLASTYLLYPLYQHYRYRYSHYLPLETLSSRTLSIRTRIQDAIVGFLAPSAWRRSAQDRVVAAEEDSDDGFDSEDGEELGDVDESTRREYSHGQDSVDATRRLSRDLEEGFRDDSDDEVEESRAGR